MKASFAASVRGLAGVAGGTCLAIAGLGLFLTGSEACTTRDCIATSLTFSGGDMVDENTWESNTLDGDWLAYGPQAYIYVQIPAFANRTFLSAEVDISPVENPNLYTSNGFNNWTVASGDLVEFEQAVTGGPPAAPYFSIIVHNSTCASYDARIIIHFDPLEGGADAGAGDAALD